MKNGVPWPSNLFFFLLLCLLQFAFCTDALCMIHVVCFHHLQKTRAKTELEENENTKVSMKNHRAFEFAYKHRPWISFFANRDRAFLFSDVFNSIPIGTLWVYWPCWYTWLSMRPPDDVQTASIHFKETGIHISKTLYVRNALLITINKEKGDGVVI